MKQETKRTIQIYLSHTAKYKWLGFGIVFFMIGSSVMNMIQPLYFKRFIDALIGMGTGSSFESLLYILGAIALLMFSELATRRLAVLCANYFFGSVMADLAASCYNYLQQHSFSFFNDNFVGSLVKRVGNFTRAFEVIFDRIFWDVLPMIVNIIVIFIILFTRDARLAGILGVWMALFLIVNWYFTRYKFSHDLARSKQETKSTGVLADNISNNSNIKLFTGYGREQKHFGGEIGELKRLRIHAWNLDLLFDGIQGLLTLGLEIGMYYYAIHLWRAGILTPGDFVLLQAYLIVVFQRVWDFGRVIRNMYEQLSDAEEMTVILTRPHDITDQPGAKALKVKNGGIQFANVQFNYRETRTVLSKFDLAVQPGEKLALVGPSGAGKSTVVKLILRLHDLTKGKILIDGQNIACVTQESLWKSISLVPQEPILFHRSLKENIRYGKPGASDREVIAAAKLAHCHEFISGFPEGYETFVGERGVKLSGGERQRVAIARAILRNAPILVLDEATSSLDSESEYFIQDALNNLMKNKTVIVIAHRLSTIMKMDRIVVIDHGQVVEEGTHEKLLEIKKGLYQKLWQIQAGGFIV